MSADEKSLPSLHSCLLVSADEGQHIDSTMCLYCRQTPCITTDSREHLGFRAAHVQNHVRRRKDYKTYWRALKKCGLWQDPVCLARKVELGDRIDAVRERMPKCVVKNVRERFPNPLGIPYMGHKRDWDWGKVQFFTSPYSIISILYFQNCITISTTIIIMLHNRETGDV